LWRGAFVSSFDGAVNPSTRCVPSQNGLVRDLPHLQSAIVLRLTSIGSPD
jgi:hypothetical protein